MTVVSETTDSVRYVWLDRPSVHNALDDATLALIEGEFDVASRDSSIRVVVLGGRGPSFISRPTAVAAPVRAAIRPGNGDGVPRLATTSLRRLQ